jgi:hypothetical protein
VIRIPLSVVQFDLQALFVSHPGALAHEPSQHQGHDKRQPEQVTDREAKHGRWQSVAGLLSFLADNMPLNKFGRQEPALRCSNVSIDRVLPVQAYVRPLVWRLNSSANKLAAQRTLN